jgi:hypothetical protein
LDLNCPNVESRVDTGQILDPKGRGVRLLWAKSKPKRPNGPRQLPVLPVRTPQGRAAHRIYQRLGFRETLAEPVPRPSPPPMRAASLARVLATCVLISLLPLKAGTAPADSPPSLRRSAPLGIRGANQARKRGRTSGALACLQGDAESAPWIEVSPETRGDASVKGVKSLLGGIWCT